jgi:signal transduction histidine kinase
VNFEDEYNRLLNNYILHIDHYKIAIVIKNLLSNAFKFIIHTEGEKQITVTIDIIHICNVINNNIPNTTNNSTIDNNTNTSMLKIEVHDNGPGITKVSIYINVYINKHIT